MNTTRREELAHLRALQETVPLLKLTTTELILGDVFEANGMTIVSVEPIVNDPANVLLTFSTEGVTLTLTEPVHTHLIRRPVTHAS